MEKETNIEEEIINNDVLDENDATEKEIDIEDQDVEDEIEFDDSDDELQDQVDVLNDKYTRLLAEYQNFKRRSAEEGLKAKTLAKKETISEILDVLDNLERALLHVDFEAEEVDDLAKGVKMVYDMFVNKLEKLGVQEIDCSGLLDHNLHMAMATDCNEDLENDQITEVLQKGYIIDDVVIRHAIVKANQK